MKKIFTLFFMIISLSACTHPWLFRGQHIIVTKKAPAQCLPLTCQQRCEIEADKCHAMCRNNCAQCSAYANQSAKTSYRKYQREKVIEGGTIARQLKSYRDPLQCRKTTCSCKADYQLCISSCGGKIRKQLKETPVC